MVQILKEAFFPAESNDLKRKSFFLRARQRESRGVEQKGKKGKKQNV
jgi:hypothetical protein